MLTFVCGSAGGGISQGGVSICGLNRYRSIRKYPVYLSLEKKVRSISCFSTSALIQLQQGFALNSNKYDKSVHSIRNRTHMCSLHMYSFHVYSSLDPLWTIPRLVELVQPMLRSTTAHITSPILFDTRSCIIVAYIFIMIRTLNSPSQDVKLTLTKAAVAEVARM